MNFILLLTLICLQGPVELDNVPTPVKQSLQVHGDRYEISRRMNPFYLRGDFNGDGRPDFVVLVKERKSEKEGFAFCFAGVRKPEIVGAGQMIALEGGVRGDDFKGLDVWGIEPKWKRKPLRDAVYLEQAEGGSGWLFWQRGKIVWEQGGI
jgi:hypothetical protein